MEKVEEIVILHVLSRKIVVPYECFPCDPSIKNPIAFCPPKVDRAQRSGTRRWGGFFLPKLQAFFCIANIFTETHFLNPTHRIHVIMVYLHTFGWLFMVNVGQYTIHGCYECYGQYPMPAPVSWKPVFKRMGKPTFRKADPTSVDGAMERNPWLRGSN